MKPMEFFLLAGGTALGVALGYLLARQVEIQLLKRA